MKCYQCSTRLPEGEKTCPACGKSQSFTPGLVQAAMDGDQEAITQLYNRTYNAVYQAIKSMIRDEDTVLDILQDSYVKGFQNLDRLRTPEMFPAWMKQIAANTARDWLKRKKPVLFSELENEDGEMTLDFEDDRTDNLPEAVIDQRETTRLVNEILDSLSEEQRVVVGLFYYQQRSVKEIADMLGCSENTVKSRLNYARKKIKVQVEDLERRGTKLYSLSPIPFLLWLFRGLQTQAAELPSPAVLEAVQAQCGGLSAAGAPAHAPAGTTGSAARAARVAGKPAHAAAKTAGAAGKALAVKIASGVLAVAVLGAGAVAVLPALTRQGAEPPQQTAEVVATAPLETEDAVLPNEAEAELSPLEAALEQYRVVVSQASSYTYGPAAPSGNYRYALVQLQPEDPVPTLLLAQESADYTAYVRLFQYDPDSRTLRQPAETLYEGRALLTLPVDGNGVFETDFDGATGELWIYRATLEGDSLQKILAYQGRVDIPRPEDFRSTEIVWHDIGDTAALGGESPDLPAETSDAGASLPVDGDRIVFRGTIQSFGYDEFLEFLGYPDPNGQWADKAQTFRIIVLDEPQTMQLLQYGMMGPQEGTANIIDVSRAGNLADYDGQNLIFSIDPNEAYWPSDTSLPLGQPRARDVHVLQ